MRDLVEVIGNSKIQHGPFNDRIYLMKLSKKDFPGIIKDLQKLSKDKGYSKIFVKIPTWAKVEFEQEGFIQEAFIPKFYLDGASVYFMAKYLDDNRRKTKYNDKVNAVLQASKKEETLEEKIDIMPKYDFKQATLDDADSIAELYSQVFETYPFPIHDSSYIASTMKDNYMYFGIWHGDKLIAISSADMDFHGSNAEMTDFATLPEYRGEGLATYLLSNMESAIGKKGIKTTYSIARALSFGMNKVFARSKYKYGGTLINNTNIFGELESMNVWYKHLMPSKEEEINYGKNMYYSSSIQ